MGHRYRFFILYMKDKKILTREDILSRLSWIHEKTDRGNYADKKAFLRRWELILSFPEVFGVKIANFPIGEFQITLLVGAYFEMETNFLDVARSGLPFIEDKMYPNINSYFKQDGISKTYGKYFLLMIPLHKEPLLKPSEEEKYSTYKEKNYYRRYRLTELTSHYKDFFTTKNFKTIIESSTTAIIKELEDFKEKFTLLQQKLVNKKPLKQVLEYYNKLNTIGLELEQISILNKHDLSDKGKKLINEQIQALEQNIVKDSFFVNVLPLNFESFKHQLNVQEFEEIKKIRKFFDQVSESSYSLSELELLHQLAIINTTVERTDNKIEKYLSPEEIERRKNIKKSENMMRFFSSIMKTAADKYTRDLEHRTPKIEKNLMDDFFKSLLMKTRSSGDNLTLKSINENQKTIMQILDELKDLLSFYQKNIVEIMVNSFDQEFKQKLYPVNNENAIANTMWLFHEQENPNVLETIDLAILVNFIPKSLKILEERGSYGLAWKSESILLRFNGSTVNRRNIWKMMSSLHHEWKLDILIALYPYYRTKVDPKFKEKMQKRYEDFKGFNEDPIKRQEYFSKLFGVNNPKKMEEKQKLMEKSIKHIQQINKEIEEEYQNFVEKLKKESENKDS